MTRAVLTIAFAILALGCSGSTLAGDGDVGQLDGGREPSATEEDPNQPGSCFEIFPSTEWPEAKAPEYHQTPTVFELGDVPVGTEVEVLVGYFNFCGTPYPSVLSSGWLDGPVDPAFEAVEVPDAIDGETVASYTRLGFTPGALGEYEATFRLQFGHGYYDIVIAATGVEGT